MGCPARLPTLWHIGGLWAAVAGVLLAASGPVMAQSESVQTKSAHSNAVSTAPPSASAPQVQAIGVLTVNRTIRLPAFALTVTDSVSDSGWLATRPARMAATARLAPRFADRLVAYAHHGGWMLVPKGWRAVAGSVGANGSSFLDFVPPSGQPGRLTYLNTSACVGCAMTEAGLVFPEAARDAQDNDFSVAQVKPGMTLHTTRLRPHFMAYRLTGAGQQVDGLAHYNARGDLPYFRVEVSLPPAERDLATPILNWHLPVE